MEGELGGGDYAEAFGEVEVVCSALSLVKIVCENQGERCSVPRPVPLKDNPSNHIPHPTAPNTSPRLPTTSPPGKTTLPPSHHLTRLNLTSQDSTPPSFASLARGELGVPKSFGLEDRLRSQEIKKYSWSASSGRSAENWANAPYQSSSSRRWALASLERVMKA